MRLRALPLLLVLAVADYALWKWSIADGHDVVSLVAGLTLLPLAAATLALLAVGAARLLTFALERPSARGRESGQHTARGRTTNMNADRTRAANAGRAGKRTLAGAAGADTSATPRSAPPTRPAETAARKRSSRRLAA